MAGSLSVAQMQAYAERGYLAPLRALTAEEAAAALAEIRAAEATFGARFFAPANEQQYLHFPWADALMRHGGILDTVESIIGPDIACGGAQLFTKEPGDTGYISWHQDGAYWGCLANDIVTAWVALTPSVPENGCVCVVPGTHRSKVPHTETFAPNNMLARGQQADFAIHAGDVVHLKLEPGEISLHHGLIVHGSEPNRASYPRVGFSIRYAPSDLYAEKGQTKALVVRGVNHAQAHDSERRQRAQR